MSKPAPPRIVKLESLNQINLNAAGLDIGDEEIYVCVPEDSSFPHADFPFFSLPDPFTSSQRQGWDAGSVRRFGTFTVARCLSPGRAPDFATRHLSIGDVRGKGLMIGVEVVRDKTTKAPAPDLHNQVNHLAFEHGLLLISCSVSTTRFIPPLIITRAEIDEGLAIFEHALTLDEAKLL